MDKKELKRLLKKFEYETCSKRMRIVQFHDTYVVCLFEELVAYRSPFDPADIDVDVDVFMEKVSLLDIANSIDEMPSAYWHSVAEDIRLWYEWHKSAQLLRKAMRDRYNLINNEEMYSDARLHHLDKLIDILEWEVDVLQNK